MADSFEHVRHLWDAARAARHLDELLAQGSPVTDPPCERGADGECPNVATHYALSDGAATCDDCELPTEARRKR